ncbi:MAG: guanylate kinase [Acidobacteria bacterium]|nr:guanylate kinase [Acidobacteriota bacterium]
MSGQLIVVSSPSGGGKTSLIRRVMADRAAAGVPCHFSISHTTRTPRPTEHDGVDYHFVTENNFSAMVARGEFLEHATYVGHRYGTSRHEVDPRLDAGTDVFLDIDVQGARQVRDARPDALLVFVFPPSREELERRLRGRRQDDDAAIERRLAEAREEMRQYAWFDCVIINGCFDEAAAALATVVAASRFRRDAMKARAEAILAGFTARCLEGS